MALDELINFSAKTEAANGLDFAAIFIGLISTRPGVCAEALDRFADLRTLGVRTVHMEFEKCIKDSSRADSSDSVSIALHPPCEKKETVLSLSLLQAASVLLSIWTDSKDAEQNKENGDDGTAKSAAEATKFVNDLANMLLHPIESKNAQEAAEGDEKGLASAKMAQSGKSAVSVESVSATLPRIWFTPQAPLTTI